MHKKKPKTNSARLGTFMYIIQTKRISSKSEIVKIVPKRKYLQIMYLFETFSVCYFHLQLFLNTFDWISFLHACANCSFSCIQLNTMLVILQNVIFVKSFRFLKIKSNLLFWFFTDSVFTDSKKVFPDLHVKLGDNERHFL